VGWLELFTIIYKLWFETNHRKKHQSLPQAQQTKSGWRTGGIKNLYRNTTFWVIEVVVVSFGTLAGFL
jgi:hypothetical protein